MAYIRLCHGNDPSRAHIYSLYLTPEALGKGQGAKLMELMLEKAKKAGVKTITLDSTLTAHGFYKKYGFQDTGPIIKHNFGGSQVRAIPMALNLPAISQPQNRTKLGSICRN